MKAREIMNASAVRVSPTTSVRMIAGLMASERAGIVCVCDERDRPLGVLTDRDIVVRVCANSTSGLDTVLAQEVMTPHPRTCHQDVDIQVIESAMKEQRSSRILVVGDEGELVGVITLAEIWHYQSPLEAAPISQSVMDREYRAPPSGGHYSSGMPMPYHRPNSGEESQEPKLREAPPYVR